MQTTGRLDMADAALKALCSHWKRSTLLELNVIVFEELYTFDPCLQDQVMRSYVSLVAGLQTGPV
eukprot:174946-Amphidinium_carterae.2